MIIIYTITCCYTYFLSKALKQSINTHKFITSHYKNLKNFCDELDDQMGVQVGPEKLKTLKEQVGVLNQNGLEALVDLHLDNKKLI